DITTKIMAMQIKKVAVVCVHAIHPIALSSKLGQGQNP
ncbi:MAG: hypothetical protein ACI9OI_001623, partial [Chitinophagales bacterium]